MKYLSLGGVRRTAMTLVGIALSGMTAAQEPSSTAGIEEVLVTAQKRSESLQDVPLSVTALTARTIEEARIENAVDIASRTPNFTIGVQNPSEPELTIRGIGSTDREAGSDRSVTVFVDEVYIGRAGASTFDLFDLERIEVLRGPQGTLFGRNVVGGAISLITAKPKRETAGKVQLTVGDNGLTEFRGMWNAPVGQNSALRLAASVKERDGYFFDQRNGISDFSAPESRNARVQWLTSFSEHTDLLLSLDYSKDQLDGVAARITQGAATNANFAAALAGFGNYVPPADLFTIEPNVVGSQDRKILGLSARLTHRTDNFELTFLPAYRTTDYFSDRDLAGIPLRGTGAATRGFLSREIIDEEYNAFSAELRLTSPESDSRWSWVAGLYYLDEDVVRLQIRERQANNAFSRPLFTQGNNSKSSAVFGQIAFKATDRLTFAAGARYTSDDKDFAGAVSNTLTAAQIAQITTALGMAPNLNPATSAYSVTSSDSWSEVTPKFTADFKVSDDILLYAGYSKGFKSGGFNGLGATAAEATTLFDPEFANNIEVGAKSSFFANRLQLNLALFKLDFEDLQLRDRKLTIPGDESSAIVNIINAAQAEIQGAELEFIAAPTQNLRLSGHLAILDSEITKVVPGSTTIVGLDLPRAPKSTYGLGGVYSIPIGNVGKLDLRADWRHTGKQYYDINEPPASEEPEFDLIDVRVGFSSSDNRWGAALWCKNIGDEEYRSHTQQILNGRAAVTQVGDPRQCGVSFNANFGASK